MGVEDPVCIHGGLCTVAILVPHKRYPPHSFRDFSRRRLVVVVASRKRMCVNKVDAVDRFRSQFRPIKVEAAFNSTIRELGVRKLWNIETI